MKFSDLMIQRDRIAHDAAVDLCGRMGATRGPAHRELLVSHLGWLIEGHGLDETLRWLDKVIERASEGQSCVADFAEPPHEG